MGGFIQAIYHLSDVILCCSVGIKITEEEWTPIYEEHFKKLPFYEMKQRYLTPEFKY